MITSSRIAWGDQLGAQLTKLAQLVYIAEMNEQELVMFDELRDYRRGYQFLNVFETPGFLRIINRASRCKNRTLEAYYTNYHTGTKDWKSQMNRIYKSTFYRCLDRAIYEWVRQSYRDFQLLKGYKDGVSTDKELLCLEKSKNYDIIEGFGTYRDGGV